MRLGIHGSQKWMLECFDPFRLGRDGDTLYFDLLIEWEERVVRRSAIGQIMHWLDSIRI
jgi:hypothetical protein